MIMRLTFYDFTEEELQSNRRGFITPRQKQWVLGMAKGIRASQRGGFPFVVFFMILGFGLVLGMNLSNERARIAFLSDPLNIILLCAAIPVILGIFGLGAFFANRRAAKLERSRLKAAEGVIEWEEESSRVGPTYFLYVGDAEFKFGEDLSGIFPAGRRGRVFYCETSMLQLILSHELLD